MRAILVILLLIVSTSALAKKLLPAAVKSPHCQWVLAMGDAPRRDPG